MKIFIITYRVLFDQDLAGFCCFIVLHQVFTAYALVILAMSHLSNVSSPVLPQDLHSYFDTACTTLPPSNKIVDSQLSG